MRRTLPLLACLLGPAAPVPAQGRPLEAPTRDVSVTCRMADAGLPEETEIRMSWLVAENKVRIDFPQGLWSVVDRKNVGDSSMAVGPMRAVMPMPTGAGALPGMFNDADGDATRYADGGAAVHAGHACTVWRFENDRGGTGEACVTADGVVLRGAGALKGVAGAMDATRVDYAPQHPARFRRPEDYRAVQLPPVPPGIFGR